MQNYIFENQLTHKFIIIKTVNKVQFELLLIIGSLFAMLIMIIINYQCH